MIPGNNRLPRPALRLIPKKLSARLKIALPTALSSIYLNARTISLCRYAKKRVQATQGWAISQ